MWTVTYNLSMFKEQYGLKLFYTLLDNRYVIYSRIKQTKG